jgi:hypothetical protein
MLQELPSVVQYNIHVSHQIAVCIQQYDTSAPVEYFNSCDSGVSSGSKENMSQCCESGLSVSQIHLDWEMKEVRLSRISEIPSL